MYDITRLGDCHPRRLQGGKGPLYRTRGANRALFEAGKGLARCYHESGKAELAAEVVDQLLVLDPGDPLRVKDLFGDGG